MNQELIKRLQAYIEREWLTRKQTGLAQGLAMIPPAGEIEQLLTNCLSALAAQQEPTEPVAMEWIAGAPPKPWCNEWFIAKTTFGDRVVLTALPEEYTYDFKTADDTYIKADKIVCWMQFPDSEYIAPPSGVRDGMLRAAEICKEWEAKLSQGAGYAIRTAREEITRAAAISREPLP